MVALGLNYMSYPCVYGFGLAWGNPSRRVALLVQPGAFGEGNVECMTVLGVSDILLHRANKLELKHNLQDESHERGRNPI